MSGIQAHFTGRLGDFALDAGFAVPARGVTALFGPSGCGKTTVLRCMAGLQRLRGELSVAGEVWQDGTRFLPAHRRPIGYVFQEASLFPHLSVRGNLEYGHKRARRRGQGSGLAAVAAMLGLERLLERAPVHLSGGERQRVAIGRALMAQPALLLMDEPLAALDQESKREIIPYLERLHDELAVPVVYVSHDMAEVERLADQLVLMQAGRVRAVGGLAQMLTDPALPFARAPEAGAALSAVVLDYDPGDGLTSLALGEQRLLVPGRIGAAGSRQRLRIAASDVALCHRPVPPGLSILNALEARIVASEPAGEHQRSVFLELAEGPRLIARITNRSWHRLGLYHGDEVCALVKSVSILP